jgi:hypothetical protein
MSSSFGAAVRACHQAMAPCRAACGSQVYQGAEVGAILVRTLQRLLKMCPACFDVADLEVAGRRERNRTEAGGRTGFHSRGNWLL